MKKTIICLLTALTALTLTSCHKAAERAINNIHFDGIESFQMQGLSGAEVKVHVTNDTGYKLKANTAVFDIFYNDNQTATVTLREPVEIDGHTSASLTTLWKLQVEDPLALIILLRKLNDSQTDNITVSYQIEGRGGPMPIDFSNEKQPLSKFLDTFGVSIDDVKNYLKE